MTLVGHDFVVSTATHTKVTTKVHSILIKSDLTKSIQINLAYFNSDYSTLQQCNSNLFTQGTRWYCCSQSTSSHRWRHRIWSSRRNANNVYMFFRVHRRWRWVLARSAWLFWLDYIPSMLYKSKTNNAVFSNALVMTFCITNKKTFPLFNSQKNYL